MGALSLGLLGALTCGARVVHTPKMAIANNYQNGAMPALDEQGGRWSFHQRFWWNDPNVMDLTTPRTMDTGFVGYGTALGEFTEPYVFVNPTDHDIIDGSMTCNRTDCPVHAGEVVIHPYHWDDNNPHRAVLRYTVTRNGRYSLSLLVRSINAIWWQTSHYTDFTLLVNNSIIYQNQVYRPGVVESVARTIPQLDYAQLDPISFENMYLVEGDTIDFVVGCGLDEGGDLGYQGDGVALSIEIVEEDETESPVERVWDLGSSYYAAETGENVVNPFPDRSGTGTWGLYLVSDIRAVMRETGAPILLNTRTDITEGPVGPRLRVDAQVEPNFLVYDPQATCAADSGMDGQSMINDRVAPGEIVLHPANQIDGAENALLMRFIVPEDGRYVIDAILRDVSQNPKKPVPDTSGVEIQMYAQGGTLIHHQEVSLEKGFPCSFSQSRIVSLKAGAPLDVLVYCHLHYEWDGTAGRVRVFKLKDAAGGAASGFDAAAAFNANLNGASVNPYTDASGAVWTAGKSVVPGQDFTAFTKAGGSGDLRGWCDQNNGKFYDTLPEVKGNALGDTIVDVGGVARQAVFADEYFIHPNKDIYGVLRFTAPRDGVYSVRSAVRDVNPQNFGSDGMALTCGVLCHIVANGHYVATDFASSDYYLWQTYPFFRVADLHPDQIYLRAGESIDFCVGVRGARDTNSDATAITERITCVEADQAEQTVAVDLRTTAARVRPYVFSGRVGWSDQAWNPTVAETDALTAKGLWISSKRRTETGFALTHGTEPCTSAALGVNEVLNDGVVSTGTNDVYTFTFTNLPPNQEFTLYCYGAASTDGASVPVFTVGGVSASPTEIWSRANVKDIAVLKATSDADGALTGTFAGSADVEAGGAAFCGVQLAGRAFVDWIPRGTMITIW